MASGLFPDIFSIAGSSEIDLVSGVERAIYQLYSDPDSGKKTAADQWLQTLQHSPHTWSLSWTLLQHQTLEVKNFGALMLCSKINHRWSDLPPEDYNVLRIQLFQHLAHISSSSAGQRLLLLQLSRALVGVAFHTLPEQWPNVVVSCIHSLKKACQEVSGSDFATSVVQLLTVFPEEFEKMSDTSTSLRRGLIKGELVAGLTSVTSLMQEVLTKSHGNVTKNNAIKCCNSWIHLSSPLPELQTLSNDLFCCLREPDLLECASDALYDLVSNDDSFKYPNVLCKIMQRLLEMREFITAKMEDNDMEDCECLVRLVEGVAEANIEFLLNVSESSPAHDTDNAMAILQLVLDFLSLPGSYPVDEHCSEVTFQFWENFLDRIGSADPDQCKFLLDIYASSMQSLIEVFPEKAQYPPDTEWQDTWSDDDKDSFVKYRESLCDVADCLQQTVHMEYLQHLTTLLSSLLTGSQQPAWQPVEALLFLLQGVASNVTQQSSYLLQNILCLFPRFPPHPTLFQTALSLIGLLSNWFKRHLSLLQAVLPMILQSLMQPELASCAALAFKDVCGDCANELSTVATQLIPHCQQGLSSPHLTASDCVRLVVAIGSVLSVLPLSSLLPPLEALISGRIESLQLLAEQAPSDISKPLLEKELDILGALCHHIYPKLQEGEQHPVLILLVQLFPALQSIINSWSSDDNVVESICSLINHAMHTVGTQYSPLLEQTVELLVKCYAAVHHHSLLNTAVQLVKEFGKEGSCVLVLSALLQPLHSLSVQLFQSAMQELPYNVQAYLDLVSAALKFCPMVLLSIDGVATDTFDIGLASLKLPEQHTVISASSFFLSLFPLVPSLPHVAEVLACNGMLLVEYVLQALAWAAPRSYLPHFSDILHSLCFHCLALLSPWLEDVLSVEGFPSTHVTAAEKEQFKTSILKSQGNKKALQEKAKEFSLKCRGFHGTLYALETS